MLRQPLFSFFLACVADTLNLLYKGLYKWLRQVCGPAATQATFFRRSDIGTQPQSRSSFACSLSLAIRGARVAAVVRALASHQYGPGSNPGVEAICGLSLLLVLSLAPRGFSPGTPVFPSPQKPTFPNSNSTRNQVDKEPLD